MLKLLPFLVLLLCGGVVHSEPGSTNNPLQMVTDYSIPVLWDGREVGSISLTAGTQLELLEVQGNMLVCKHKKQTVRIPAQYSNYDSEIHQVIPSKIIEPATAKKTPPAKDIIAEATNPNTSDPVTSVNTYPAWLPADLTSLLRYARNIQKLSEIKKMPARQYLYLTSKYHQPKMFQNRLRTWSERDDLGSNVSEFLSVFQSGVAAFDRREWEIFESHMKQATSLAE